MGRTSLFADAGADGQFARRRNLPEADLDITPMIDVTFLLLIFFMVSSTMQGSRDADVPIARHGDGVSTRSSAIVTVEAAENASATIKTSSGNGPLTSAAIEDIRPFVESELKDGRSHVIIRAERYVPTGTVQRICKIVNEIDGVTFSIGVQEERNRN